ncbi:hypothetical protein [Niveispirillum sp. BGYR6]|uniref:hypothetical protein n=1 Tax=Niveispirillum sp. BGYR6 TaxID=2971249 RepID=UPI0022B9D3BF|nr:hypothetical protein [Niveispirillum sp. BGYR6]MDG5495518.1 hypothetical protein [Niveispirillum sp. BGYR6]
MTTIGSASQAGGGNDLLSLGKSTRPKVKTAEALEKARAEAEAFTKAHAHLGAKDYLKAKLEESEGKTADLLASGEATGTFKMQLDGRTYTLAGSVIDMSGMKVTNNPAFSPVEAERPAPALLDADTQAQAQTAQTSTVADRPAVKRPTGLESVIETSSRQDWTFSQLAERLRRWG